MRKHIIGFALFTFIVTCGVMVYAFLYTPPMPQIEEVKIPVIIKNEPRKLEEVNEIPDPLSYKLKSYTVDLEQNKANIEVKLDWNSTEKPPAILTLDFGLTTANKPFWEISLGNLRIKQPFAEGRSVRRSLVLDLKGFGGLSPKETAYYGYMDVREAAETSTSSAVTLVYNERNRMIGAIPALVRHPLKK